MNESEFDRDIKDMRRAEVESLPPWISRAKPTKSLTDAEAGDIHYDTSTRTMFIFDGVSWQEALLEL